MRLLFCVLIVFFAVGMLEPTIYFIQKKTGRTDSVYFEINQTIFGKKFVAPLYYAAGALCLAGAIYIYIAFIAEML